MPLHYVFDNQKQRFIVRLTGEVTVDELASFVATQITIGSWRLSVLYDATAPGVSLGPLEAVPVDLWRELRDEHGARGHVAFVVADDHQRAIADRYANAVVAAGLFTAAVFSEVGPAEQWLDATDAARNDQ
jgi:hypothetical protein